MANGLGNTDAGNAQHLAMPVPRLDPASALLFVINNSAGHAEADAREPVATLYRPTEKFEK